MGLSRMPTKTFYNLPEGKREKLLDAIREEFTRVPFDEVSINQIIRAAGIPRGSFYQYFEDKRDMLHYLMGDYQRMLGRQALASLKNSGGDLFQMFLDILDFTFAFVTEEKNNAFFKNVFSDIRVSVDFFLQHVNGDSLGDFFDKLFSCVDMDLLDIRSDEDFGNMLGILLSLTGSAFAKVFFDTLNYENRRSQYAAQLELLKRGFLSVKKVGG